jgi:hypothetical protein
MEVSRHKELSMLAGYVRRANMFADHCASSFLGIARALMLCLGMVVA